MMAIQIDQGAKLPTERPWYRHLYVQVLIAIFLGILIGHFWPATGEALKPLGDGFIKLVRMIIAPVIFLTIVTGIAGMRDLARVGRVALKAFVYFLFFSTLALIIGMIDFATHGNAPCGVLVREFAVEMSVGLAIGV